MQPYAHCVAVGQQLSQFLSLNGDGTGGADMAVDGSSTPHRFKLTAPAGYTILLYRVIISFRDSGSIDSGAYGNTPAGAPLTNGITFGILDSTGAVTSDRSATLPVRSCIDWNAYCYDAGISNYGSGDSAFHARYSFIKDGAPLFLPPGWSYFMQVNDDLTHLVSHYVRSGGIVAKA